MLTVVKGIGCQLEDHRFKSHQLPLESMIFKSNNFLHLPLGAPVNRTWHRLGMNRTTDCV